MPTSLSWFPSTPAIWCRSYDEPLELAGLAEALSASQPYLAWLDSARLHPSTGRFSLLGWDPWLIYASAPRRAVGPIAHGCPSLNANPLEAIRQLLARCSRPADSPGLPPVGLGLFAFLSYELNRWIERLAAPKPSPVEVPGLLMVGMRRLVVVDHLEQRSWCVSMEDPDAPPARAKSEAFERLEAVASLVSRAGRPSAADSAVEPHGRSPWHLRDAPPGRHPAPSPTPPWRGGPYGGAGSEELLRSASVAGPIEPSLSQAGFEAMVCSAQALIAAGEIFQANLSHQMSAAFSGPAWPLYQMLRHVNPSPFACLFQCPDFTLLSCSPERLVHVREGRASTRPIAGTRPRGATAEQDVLNSLELILSEKERAEHIMLVDLARNDLGRVCRSGSVRVDELMTIEDYSHVMHIVSSVSGRLRAGCGPADVIRAIFPGGTITGCPKVRAMEIIRELEPVARGAYTGSFGYLGFDGSMDLNILIRTLVLQRDRIWFHVGAGIVADSQPDREYHETLAKAGALLQTIRMIPSASKLTTRSGSV